MTCTLPSAYGRYDCQSGCGTADRGAPGLPERVSAVDKGLGPGALEEGGMQPDLRRKTTATIECPKSMVGRVIGKNGETIKALQTYTGSLIQVNQIDNPCQITISGAPQSLSLAVSMVADIVKGTFKGFALLRQVASPGMARPPGMHAAYPTPLQHQPQLPLPQPVYAPGYGLIPPSQLYGHSDERLPTSANLAGGGQSAAAFNWPGQPSHPSVILGLPTGLSQHQFTSSAGILNGMPGPGSTMAVQPAMFNAVPVGGGSYGGLAYYPAPQDAAAQARSSELAYQDAVGGMYAPGGADPAASSSNAKLIQAAAASHGSHPMHARRPASTWLPRPNQSAMPGYGAAGNGGNMGGELLDPGAAASAVSGGGGNLVMDADGKVYYVNAL